MIITRTGCIVGCDAFYGGYANWFAKTFGDEQTSLGTHSTVVLNRLDLRS